MSSSLVAGAKALLLDERTEHTSDGFPRDPDSRNSQNRGFSH